MLKIIATDEKGGLSTSLQLHWCSSVPRMSNQKVHPNKKWILSCKPSSVNMLTTGQRDASPESKAETGDKCLWFSRDGELLCNYMVYEPT